jgi:U3 small nucleolar RNA-associated protein 3
VEDPAPAKRRKVDSTADSADEDEEEEALGGWGSSRQDYYGADAIDTEQAAVEEEQEAKRLQQKQLQEMTEADFGFEDDTWTEQLGEGDAVEDTDARLVTEILPEIQISKEAGPEERLKLLKARYPEFEPLSKEFVKLQKEYRELAPDAELARLALAEHTPTKGHISSGLHVTIVKYQALAAYLGTTAMYFALLSSTAEDQCAALAKAPLELRDHMVMDSLVKTRATWERARNLQSLRVEDEIRILEESRSPKERNVAATAEAEKPTNSDSIQTKMTTKPKKTKKQAAVEAAQVQSDARRAERLRAVEEDLASLATLTSKEGRKVRKEAAPTKVRHTAASQDVDSDFGDETEMTLHEAAEKAKRKKSLRFYTSQIAQKTNRRGAAGRDAGGDTDIPHRERLRDRQDKLNAQAEKRGKQSHAAGEALGGESDDEDKSTARAVRGENDEDDYYDMLVGKSNKTKVEKKRAARDAYNSRVAGEGLWEEERVGVDGKRKVSYQIEKNKGLTPHRKKDVRNPRVKKRKKFEERKKKLSSVRAVYSKAGEGRGGYKGELTGISSVVKGIKL